MIKKPYPFTPEQEAWLRDLETTEEPQTTEWLHVVEPVVDFAGNEDNAVGYCCLGRACVVLGIPEERNDRPWTTFGGEADATLPKSATTALRLRDDTGSLWDRAIDPDDPGNILAKLTDLNDEGWSFKQIAAYIRENPWNVFLPLEEETP